MGIWLEKGICFMFPAYLPNPLGEIVAYMPNSHEVWSVVAILAFGTLMFTLLVKVAVPIMAMEEVVGSDTTQPATRAGPRWLERPE